MRRIGEMYRLRPIALKAILLAVTIFAGTSTARAGFIVNGTFTPDLGGWTVSNSNDDNAVTVSAGGGVVTISEPTSHNEVDLFQTFTLPSGSKSISFKIVGLTTNLVSQ